MDARSFVSVLDTRITPTELTTTDRTEDILGMVRTESVLIDRTAKDTRIVEAIVLSSSNHLLLKGLKIALSVLSVLKVPIALPLQRTLARTETVLTDPHRSLSRRGLLVLPSALRPRPTLLALTDLLDSVVCPTRPTMIPL
jgi:hypothetical protein